MLNAPLVSICIPSYNSSRFIAETIQSALNQTYHNIEIVVTDDCSIDNTAEVIESFEDERIKFFQNESNLGVEGNWNLALQKASGKYIKLMGADDIIYDTFIEKQVEILEDPIYCTVSLVTSHKDIINQNGKLIMTKRFPGYGTFSGVIALKKSIRRGANVIGEPVAGLFRKNVLEKSGYYNGDNLYMIDLDLWSKILLQGDLYVINNTLYAFRVSGGSLSSQIGLGQVKLYNTFVDKLSADKAFHLSVYDKYTAKFMALLMGLARNLVYLIYFRK